MPRLSLSLWFQSTPPVAGRCCDSASSSHAALKFVSIHTSRCREVLRHGAGQIIAICTVSIHTSRCREVLHRPHGSANLLFLVSIHTSRCREVLHSAMRATSSPDGLFQSTPPVAGRCCSSPITPGSVRTKRSRYANLNVPEQEASYANSVCPRKSRQISPMRDARTHRVTGRHLRFAQIHRTSGAAKSVARKAPCSRTS